ncbi:MAG: hypothetical protein LC798_10480 [Chloroflexi bacterium]|nr:hypothetical protein [Chloroflexota bacterium]
MRPAPSAPPPSSVTEAFGSTDAPLQLPGGGHAWRAGDLVLEHVNVEPAWLEREQRVLVTVDQDAFRIQRPRRTLEGRVVMDGWFARDYLEGAHEPGHRSEIVGAGAALHAALAALPERLVPTGAAADRYASLRKAVIRLS